MKLKTSDLRVGRVISNDGNFVLLEVAKNDEATFTLDEEVPDNFLTLLFLRRDEDGDMSIWNPWGNE